MKHVTLTRMLLMLHVVSALLHVGCGSLFIPPHHMFDTQHAQQRDATVVVARVRCNIVESRRGALHNCVVRVESHSVIFATPPTHMCDNTCTVLLQLLCGWWWLLLSLLVLLLRLRLRLRFQPSMSFVGDVLLLIWLLQGSR